MSWWLCLPVPGRKRVFTARNFKCSYPSFYLINFNNYFFEIYLYSEPASIFDIRKGV